MKPFFAIPLCTIALACFVAWFGIDGGNGGTVPKSSVLESRPAASLAVPITPTPSSSFGEAGAPKTFPTPTIQPSEPPVLNSAPTALVGFLEAHFDINAKYRGGNDGTLCTEEIPCVDTTPPEVAEAVAKIRDGVLEKLGDQYDSETFYRIFFMTEDGSYDPARHPKVRLDDVEGSVEYLVAEYEIRA